MYNSIYEGETFIDGWDMYDLGAYPCIVKGKGRVYVESYLVDEETLATLDRLEGYPYHYDRKAVIAKSGKHGLVYFFDTPTGTPVRTGKWSKRMTYEIY